MPFKIKRKRDKDLWLKHLRSGKHKQARGRLGVLRGEEEHNCCLGLICKVTKTAKRDTWDGFNPGVVRYGGQRNYLPDSMVQRLGIDSNGSLNETVMYNGNPYRTLANLNDAGADFNFIADVIEKQF